MDCVPFPEVYILNQDPLLLEIEAIGILTKLNNVYFVKTSTAPMWIYTEFFVWTDLGYFHTTKFSFENTLTLLQIHLAFTSLCSKFGNVAGPVLVWNCRAAFLTGWAETEMFGNNNIGTHNRLLIVFFWSQRFSLLVLQAAIPPRPSRGKQQALISLGYQCRMQQG